MIFKVIPGFYSLIILFWMFHVQNTTSWLFGLLSLFILELSHYKKFKNFLNIDVSIKKLNILFDASVLLGIGYLVYIGLTNTSNLVVSIIHLMYSLQFLFLPITILVIYNKQEYMNLNILFKGKHANKENSLGRIDILYSFFWIFSASLMSNKTPIVFLISVAVLFISVLITYALKEVFDKRVREDKKYEKLKFIAYLSSVMVFFMIFSFSMLKFYHFAGDYLLQNLFSHRNHLDPFQTNTDIGRIGALKQDSDIVMRVYSENTRQPLLEKATYSKFNHSNWSNKKSDKNAISFKLKRDSYRTFTENDSLLKEVIIGKAKNYFPTEDSIKIIEQNVEKGHVLGRYDGYLPVVDEAMLMTNEGTMTLKDVSGVLTYHIEPEENFTKNIEIKPSEEDYHIPNMSQKTLIELDKIIAQLPDMKPETVQKYFKDNYKYTLDNQDKSSLLDFFRVRTGHCEYYATATALLYRRAGFASKYTIGYSIQEWNSFEKAFVVRKSDAHAWAKVWMDGIWVEVDSTPPDWYVPKTHTIADLWDWIKLKLKTVEVSILIKGILLMFVLSVPLIRMYKQYKNKEKKASYYIGMGEVLLKDLYKITANTIYEKYHYETLQEWLERLHYHDFVYYINESVYGKKIHHEKIKELIEKIKQNINKK